MYPGTAVVSVTSPHMDCITSCWLLKSTTHCGGWGGGNREVVHHRFIAFLVVGLSHYRYTSPVQNRTAILCKYGHPWTHSTLSSPPDAPETKANKKMNSELQQQATAIHINIHVFYQYLRITPVLYKSFNVLKFNTSTSVAA